MIALATREIEILFLSILLLLSSSFLFGWIFEKIKLPRVIGEKGTNWWSKDNFSDSEISA